MNQSSSINHHGRTTILGRDRDKITLEAVLMTGDRALGAPLFRKRGNETPCVRPCNKGDGNVPLGRVRAPNPNASEPVVWK